MRYMIIVKATQAFEAGVAPDEALIACMADYHQDLAKAGVLLDAASLKPSADGWRVRCGGDGRSVIDGPFAETKELIAGYTLIQVRSREEAQEWARRFPSPDLGDGEAEIEVRQLLELDDIGDSKAVEPLRAIGVRGDRP